MKCLDCGRRVATVCSECVRGYVWLGVAIGFGAAVCIGVAIYGVGLLTVVRGG